MVSRPSPPRLLHSISLLLLLLLSIFHASDAATALVDKVCKQTSSYPFCVRSLYSDSRTPEADEYTLAYISVGVAYNNATSTQHYISDQLRSIEVNGSSHHDQQQRLQMCSRGYQRAVSALTMAHNDLDSETFFELARLAAKASSGANDCKAAFKGVPSPTALAKGNQDLVLLCEICGVVAKLFTVMCIPSLVHLTVEMVQMSNKWQDGQHKHTTQIHAQASCLLPLQTFISLQKRGGRERFVGRQTELSSLYLGIELTKPEVKLQGGKDN
ncbi:cell wall / vacuolar inhibitor of fructosidase 2-like [Populus alba x Populus x berolinensis]|nr:cell wall / vacuolar inhibitor of fructosidase 2-like [Populus alba x Populus x berolinensis]